MTKKRIFTDEELREMGMISRDCAVEAIEAGNKEKAIEYVNQMYTEARRQIDVRVRWEADLMSYIYEHNGADALEEALRRTWEPKEKARIESVINKDVRGRVEAHAASLRGLLQNMEITEDDEKICIKMNPCGSGQLLLQAGGYNSPTNISRMKPHRLTWGKDNFPIYCCHGPMEEIVAIETIGRPLFVHALPEKISEESCGFCYYKDDDDIPEEAYTRVGKKKAK